MPNLRSTLLGLLLTSASTVQALDAHIDLYGGIFQGADDTEPVDQRSEVGVMADLTIDLLPFGFCANVFYNKDDVSGVSSGLTEIATTEIQFGLFKQFGLPIVHPFIGGGVTFLSTSLESVGNADADETTIGAWAYVGARMNIAFFDFGVAAGYTWAEVEVDGADVDVGGWRAGVFAGVGF